MLPALGEIRAAFGLPADSTTLSWTVTLYLLGLGCCPARLRAARRPLRPQACAVRLGLALYALGAAGAALAPSLEFLLVSRLLWGIGAASPRAMALTIVRDRYVGDRMARVLSLIMAVFLIAPILGPGLGELLLLSGSWRWVFGFSVLTAAVLSLWLLRLDRDTRPRYRLPLDLRRLCGRLPSRRRGPRPRWATDWPSPSHSARSWPTWPPRSCSSTTCTAAVGSSPCCSAPVRRSWRQPPSAARGPSRLLGTRTVLHRAVAGYLARRSGAGGEFTGSPAAAPPFWLWWVLLTVLNALHVVIVPPSATPSP